MSAMPSQGDMPESRYLREMIERTAEGMERLEQRSEEWYARFDKILRGSNGKAGLEEQVRRNEGAIKRLESRGFTWTKAVGFAVLIGGVIETLRYIFGG